MKVTSLKDVENYIYSVVILPLKDLGVEELSHQSPIMGKDGNAWQLGLARESIQGEFQHNYERDSAREGARWLVNLRAEGKRIVLADYQPRRHTVTMYQREVGTIKGANILFNKLEEAFRRYTPFDKVKVLPERRGDAVNISERLNELP